MPKQLLDAHRALDATVDLCYRPAGFKAELERLKFLFDLYRKYTEPLVAPPPGRRKQELSFIRHEHTEMSFFL